MKPEDIKIRCSSLGYIMTDPKEKSPFDKWQDTKVALGHAEAAYSEMNKSTKTAEKKLASIERMRLELPQLELTKNEPHLSETCKGHLADIMVRIKYNRQTDISTKYTTKGLLVEEDSITLYSRVKRQFYKKNEERISNEFIAGCPDLYEGETIRTAKVIRDVKSSWDIFTFFRNHEGKLNAQYYWQLMGYLSLSGAKDAYLAYCLVNTPETMLIEEQRRLFYKMNCVTEENPDYIEACKELEKSMVYDDIPLNERLIEIHIPRDEDAINRIYERVKACRTYMATKYKSLFDSDVLIASNGEGCTIIEKG